MAYVPNVQKQTSQNYISNSVEFNNAAKFLYFIFI